MRTTALSFVGADGCSRSGSSVDYRKLTLPALPTPHAADCLGACAIRPVEKKAIPRPHRVNMDYHGSWAIALLWSNPELAYS